MVSFTPVEPEQFAARPPPGPAVVPVAPASIRPPRSTSTLPATRKTMGLFPLSWRTWLLVTVSPCSRTTITLGPPDSDWVTLLVMSCVPSVQLVLVTVPAFESTVVVPAALQFQVGEVLKFAAHWVASTLTDGGSCTCVHIAQWPLWQADPAAHAKLLPQPPQLPSSFWKSTHAPAQAL